LGRSLILLIAAITLLGSLIRMKLSSMILLEAAVSVDSVSLKPLARCAKLLILTSKMRLDRMWARFRRELLGVANLC